MRNDFETPSTWTAGTGCEVSANGESGYRLARRLRVQRVVGVEHQRVRRARVLEQRVARAWEAAVHRAPQEPGREPWPGLQERARHGRGVVAGGVVVDE